MQINWYVNISSKDTSIHVCRNNGRHLVAYDEDSALFDVIIFSWSDLLQTGSVGGFILSNASINYDEKHHYYRVHQNQDKTNIYILKLIRNGFNVAKPNTLHETNKFLLEPTSFLVV